MAGMIFINYGRGEDSGFVQALLSRLEQAFSSDQLFIDIDSIEPGVDFVRVLDEQVAKCDILLAVIGKGWINARDETNARRLDNPEDFVRIEIASALAQDKRVIPVLVGDARMPRSDELPETLKPLVKRGGVRLTHERFRADTNGFIDALSKALEKIEMLNRTRDSAEKLIAQRQARTAADETSNENTSVVRKDEPMNVTPVISTAATKVVSSGEPEAVKEPRPIISKRALFGLALFFVLLITAIAGMFIYSHTGGR